MDLVCIVASIAARHKFFILKLDLGCDLLLQVFVNMEVRVYSSSLLHAILHVIIACNQLLFFKVFSNVLPFFHISLPFFWKIASMPLFYRMGSGSILITSLKTSQLQSEGFLFKLQCGPNLITVLLLYKLGKQQYQIISVVICQCFLRSYSHPHLSETSHFSKNTLMS